MKYPWNLSYWHFELSSKCALACPKCDRVKNPDQELNQDISFAVFSNTFSPRFIRDNFKTVALCGNLGDSIYAKDFLQIIRYIKRHSPNCSIVVTTNGSYRSVPWWKELANILTEDDVFIFSVDGYDQESNDQYRVNSDFDSIMTGMRIIGYRSKCVTVWSMIHFSFNEQHETQIVKLAVDNGCDIVRMVQSTRFEENDPLAPSNDLFSTGKIKKRLVQLTSRKANQKFLSVTATYDNKKSEFSPACMDGNAGIYVAANGNISSCCWTAASVSDNIEMSIKKKNIIEILNDPYWSPLFASFVTHENIWPACKRQCGT